MSNEVTPVARLVAASITDARTDTTYPPGTIGVISADLARYASFTMSLMGLKYPYNSTVIWQRGCDIIDNCNKLARSCQGDWLWIMGDDHVFDTNILVRLLSRAYDDGCDLVAPWVLGRQPPFPTVVGVVNEAEKTIRPKLTRDFIGLQQVDVVGSAGLLIRKYVLEKMTDPWFESGMITPGKLGEDWRFCLRARDLGFSTWVDADIQMGHTTSMTVWPYRNSDGTAGAILDLDNNHRVFIPHTDPA